MKVFLSSTGRDLEAYRKAAFDAIQGMGYHCVRMEDFHGEALKIEDFDDRRVAECDLFVIVIGHLHGTCPDGNDSSYTELEYDSAQTLDKPCFIFLTTEKFALRQTLREPDAKHARQQAFRQRAVKGVIRNMVTSPADLAKQIVQAFQDWIQSQKKQDPKLYLDWLRDETGEIKLDELKVDRGKTLPPAMDALYFPLTTSAPAGRELAGKGERQIGERAQRVLLEEALKSRRLIIEGGPGSGKTTFLRRIAWALCRLDAEDRLRLPFAGFPLLVRIRDLDEHIAATLGRAQPGDPTTPANPRWIAHFLASQGWNLDEEFFAEKLRHPDSILLLDGLDEAANSARREDISRLILSAAPVHGCRYVVTTRPGADEGAAIRGFQKVLIAPLDTDEIEKFLRQWCLWLKRGDQNAADSYYHGLAAAVASPTGAWPRTRSCSPLWR
jgi:hypothetical protein